LQALAGPPEGDTLAGQRTFSDPVSDQPEVITYSDNPSAEDTSQGQEATTSTARATRDEAALLERYRQQMDGWRKEAERQREEARKTQEQLAQVAALLEAQQAQLQTMQRSTPQQQEGTTRPLTLREAFDAAWNGDNSKLEQYEAQQQARERALLAKQQQERARQEKETQLQGVAQTLIQKYPELQQPEIQGKIGELYAELEADPLMASLYKESPFQIPHNGKQYSIPLIVQAIQTYRSQQGGTATQQNAPMTSQAASQGKPKPTMVLPKGINDLLKDPRVAAAMDKVGMGRDMRTQQKRIWEALPDERKQSLLRQVGG
jgi:hypothetical protein